MNLIKRFPSWEGQGREVLGVSCGLGNVPHPGAGRHPSRDGISIQIVAQRPLKMICRHSQRFFEDEHDEDSISSLLLFE